MSIFDKEWKKQSICTFYMAPNSDLIKNMLNNQNTRDKKLD